MNHKIYSQNMVPEYTDEESVRIDNEYNKRLESLNKNMKLAANYKPRPKTELSNQLMSKDESDGADFQRMPS